MGILNTVKREYDHGTPSSNVPAVREDPAVLGNIQTTLQELVNQNMENTRFLRGMSRKLEEGLEQLQQNHHGMIDANSDLEWLTEIRVEIRKELKRVNQDGSEYQLSQIKEFLAANELQVTRIQEFLTANEQQITQIQEFLAANEQQVTQIRELLEQNMNNQSMVVDEIRGLLQQHVEQNEQQMEAIRALLEDKSLQPENQAEQMSELLYSNEDQVNQVKNLLNSSEEKLSDVERKLARVTSMPSMLKSVIETNNDSNMNKIEHIITDQNSKQYMELTTMRKLVTVNLWISLVAAALAILSII